MFLGFNFTGYLPTHNFYMQVTDVKSADFRCYNSQTGASAQTVNVAAGSQLGIGCNQAIYHPGVSFSCRFPSLEF